LVLFPWFLGWKDPGLAFDAFLHIGTLVAVAGYFFGDWVGILKGGIISILDRRIGFDRNRLLFWLIALGTIPAGVGGLLFHDYIEAVFRDPVLIAIPLAAIGFLMYWVDGNYPSIRHLEEMSFKDAFWIGMAQACALIPGVSRSGATITMGRLLGMNREAAARFSFLLSMPIIFAACAFSWKKLSSQTGADAIPMSCLITGLISSAVFGMLSIHVLLQWLRTADLRFFAWYRVLLAALIILWAVVPLWRA
jgi:undecaprenyl-diphosphatase